MYILYIIYLLLINNSIHLWRLIMSVWLELLAIKLLNVVILYFQTEVIDLNKVRRHRPT